MTIQYLYRMILSPVSPEDGGGWFSEAPELPGCFEHGQTPAEALAALEEAIEEWIEFARTDGLEIPEPLPSLGRFSGKFTFRVPRSLHQRLSGMSEIEGLSLNQYLLYLVTKALNGEGAKESSVTANADYVRKAKGPLVQDRDRGK